VDLCVNRTSHGGGDIAGPDHRRSLAQLKRMLERICDPDEFLSDYGLRSLSKAHRHTRLCSGDKRVVYEPAEAVSKIKGGNSNWRGPIWFPTTFLMIESLRKLAKAYGEDVDRRPQGRASMDPRRHRKDPGRAPDRHLHPQRPGSPPRIRHHRSGSRPTRTGATTSPSMSIFTATPGAGLGASHQTGWTGLVASLIDEWRAEK
jgi:hypothetical protein